MPFLSPSSSSSPRPFWKGPLPWVLLALLLRLAYLSEQQATSVLFYQPLLDEHEMAQAARQLLAGRGLGGEPLFKAPFYPVYLAGVMALAGEGWFWLARLIQHLLGVALVWAAYDAARRCVAGPGGRGGRLAGALAAAALALYGPLIRLEDSLILDFFAVFFQSLMLWALVRMRTTPFPARELRWAALAGALALLGWLNRPTLTPVLPLLALWIVGRGAWRPNLRSPRLKRRLACAALFLAFPLVGMGGIYLRNALVGGEGLLLPWQGGYNFYQANRAGANGQYLIQESYSLAQTGNPTRELAEAGYRQAVHRGEVSGAPTGGLYHAIDGYWFGKAKGEIGADPARWLGLMARKIVFLISAREIFNFEAYEIHQGLSRVLRVLPFSFGWLWPLALASLVPLAVPGGWPKARRGLGGLFWLYGGALGGAIALYFVSGRLRMPLVFPAAVLAAGGVAALTRGGFSFARRRWAVALAGALLLAGLGLSWGDWWGVRSASQRHVDYARLSNAAWRGGQYEPALRYAELCERERPGYPSAALLRGQALFSLGRLPQAASAFEESLRRLPEDPVAPFNLGIIAYYHENKAQEAAARFAEALRRQPAYHRAAWMGALARLRLGEPTAARELLRPYLPLHEGEPPQLLLIAATALVCTEGDLPQARALVGRLREVGGEAGSEALREEFQLLKLPLPPA